jgi:hypothetical protein
MSDQLRSAAHIIGFAAQDGLRGEIGQNSVNLARAGREHVVDRGQGSHQFGARAHPQQRIRGRSYHGHYPCSGPRELAQQPGVFNQQRIKVSGYGA